MSSPEVGRMRRQVEETIEVIRPALQADGGDMVLRDVNEETGVVSVTLVGACGTCDASAWANLLCTSRSWASRPDRCELVKP